MSDPVEPRRMQDLRLLTIDEVAELLRKSPAQMRWMRHNGTGPRAARLGGRVMYREQDVIDWVNAAFDASDRATRRQ